MCVCVCVSVGGYASECVCVFVACNVQDNKNNNKSFPTVQCLLPYIIKWSPFILPLLLAPLHRSPVLSGPSSFLSLLHETIDQFDCSNLWAKAQSVRHLSCNIRCTRSDNNSHSNGATSS